MNYEQLASIGLEKIAADDDEQSRIARLKEKIKDNPGKAGAGLGALVGAGLGAAGQKNIQKNNLKEIVEKLKAQGHSKDVRRSVLEAAPGLAGASGAALGAGVGAGLGTGADKIRERLQQREKQSSADIEEIYVDGLQKVAAVTGVDPEVLDEAIAMHQQELVKEAQINEFLSNFSDEEAEELLKEAAQDSPELKGLIAEQEEITENEELSKIAAMIDNMDENEAEELYNEIEGE